ncbi:MAG: hypothetical protein IKX00_01215 [Bacilli bacterium]|nr:hypothetical protein [Bacilli bacterium]
MILRKPYAFLIKHFRLIHLILTLPLIYIIRKTHLVVDFFNTYVSNGYTYQTGSDISGLYINWILYLSIFLIVVSIISIYYLLKYKEKPVKMYVIMMIYYIALFAMLIWYSGIISNMSKAVLSAKSARLYRDISLLIYLPQYVFIVFTVLRATGFNIKQFNFQSDLKELQITSEDNEEVEVGLGIDTYKTKRFFRRYKREFKYYFEENKFIIVLISTITVFALIFMFYKTRSNYDISYSQNKSFVHQLFTINIKDSIITTFKTNGEEIDGNYYLVLKTYVKNNSNRSQKLDYDNFKVYVGKNVYTPTLDRSTYFIDYANKYYGDYIKGNEEKEIALVYKIPENKINKTFKLKILSSYTTKKQKLVTKYAVVNLTPVILDKVSEVATVNVGSKLDLNGSNVGNTIITVNGYEVTKSYIYEYNSCYSENNCKVIKDVVNVDYSKSNTYSTLLVLDANFDLDKETTYGKSVKNDLDFFNDFSTVNASNAKGSGEYDAINITPKNLTNKIVLQVKGDILEPDSLDLHLTIRNKQYTVVLK